MSSVSYYRSEAARCRALAAKSVDSAMADQWRKIATEYDTLAAALEISPYRASSGPAQQQPLQQQQARSETDHK